MRRARFTEQLTVQAKGSAKVMVTVVATQELEPGDMLRRFKEEAAQDEPRRGNNIVVVGLVAVGVRKLSMHMGLFSLVCCVFVCFRVCVLCVYLCDDDDDDADLYCFSCDVLYFVQNNNTCLLVAGSPGWKRVQCYSNNTSTDTKFISQRKSTKMHS